MNATVVVLGDLGRSPRMLCHALALAGEGARVRLVGHADTPLPPALAGLPGLELHPIATPWIAGPRRLRPPVYVAYSIVKLLRLAAALAAALLKGPRPDVVLVQTPPALPTLAVALAVARLRRSRLVVDWHNLGTPLVRHVLGRGSLLAGTHRLLERGLGRRADAHLCVSIALQAALRADGIEAQVLYDRPAPWLGPTPGATARDVLRDLGLDREGCRPVVAVSPSGWTEEDDTACLLEALDAVDARLETGGANNTQPPALLILLTGRGPLREAFERRVAARRFGRVRVTTAWIEPARYATMIAACDVGLSLHRSFSGLDLAMKVEDLLGCGLPVLALDHGCVREQLQPGHGAWLFADAAELADALVTLAREGPEGARLRRLREELPSHARRTFADEWRALARPVLLPRSGAVASGVAARG